MTQTTEGAMGEAERRVRVEGITFREGDEHHRGVVDESGCITVEGVRVYDAGEIRMHLTTEFRDPRHASPHQLLDAIAEFLGVSNE